MGFFDDIGKAFSDAGKAIGHAASDVGKAVGGVVSGLEHDIDQAANTIRNLLPPELQHYADGFASAIKWCGDAANTIAKDVGEVTKLAGKVNWGDVVHAVEAAVSVVPVLGTAVSDILATAEVAINAVEATLKGQNPLEFAIRTAYTYALASVPGGAALRLILDTSVDAIIRMAVGHENPTSALLHALVDDVPDKPKIGSLSPRSVAAGLVKVVVSHRSIVDVGVDLAAEASGVAGPIAERAVRAAAQCAQHGFKPEECMHAALDIAPVPAEARKAWDDIRTSAKALGSNLLPEDLASLGAFAHDGVQAACEKVLGAVSTSGAQAVTKMLAQGRDHGHILDVMAGVDGVAKGSLDTLLAHLPVDRHATAEEVAELTTTERMFKGHMHAQHVFPQRFVEAVIAAEPHRLVHPVIAMNLSGLATPTPLDVLRAQLEAIR